MPALFGELNRAVTPSLDAMQIALRHRLPEATRVDLSGTSLAADRFVQTRDWVVALEGMLVRPSRGQPAPTLELVAQAIQDRGPRDALASLDGTWALFAFNRRTKQLWLARDATGQRSLFYARTPTGLVFASEAKALIARGQIDMSLDELALARYLSCAYLPGESTLLRGVKEVPPGVLIAFDSEREIVRHELWVPVEPSDVAEREQAIRADSSAAAPYVRDLRSTLEEVIDGYLEASDALGPPRAFLSGGVDSSLVVALAAKLGRPPHCYSISFGPDLPNELEYSGMVARHVGVPHEVVEIRPDAMVSVLEETIYFLDDPIGDPLTVPNYLISRTASQAGARRVLNGEGGDPCFGGPKNIPMLLSEWYAQPTPLSREKAYLRSYQKLYEDLPTLLRNDVLSRATARDSIEAFLSPFFDDPTHQSFLNKLQRMNLVLKGGNNILLKVERIYGRHGLMPLSPLFDRRVAERAWQSPPGLKLRGNIEKWVLKEAVRDVLPLPILERKKSGMLVPVHPWFQGDLKGYAAELLGQPSIEKRGLFNPNAVAEMRKYRGATTVRGFYGAKLWLLLTLEMWMRLFVDGEARKYQQAHPRWNVLSMGQD
ncbi:MAG: asparagine synthase-related protein [Polyangiaceae bacterium]